MEQRAQDARIRVLERTEAFAGLPHDTLRHLAEAGHVTRARRGDLLCREGEPADALLVLVAGRVTVFCTSPDGDRAALGLLTGPDVHLEAAVFDGSPRTASVQALDDVTGLRLPRAHLLSLLVSERQLVEPLVRVLGRVLRGLTARVVDQVFLDLAGRVAKTLLVLGQGEPDVQVTQAQLAELVGGTRQSVNQVLRELAGRGVVRLDRSHVVLLDVGQLSLLAGTAAPELPQQARRCPALSR